MTKRTGFLITATYFLPIDKKDFAKQALAYQVMAEIEKTGTLPADFTGTLVAVKAKQGSADIPDAPADPVDEPPLPEVAEADKVNAKK